MSFRFQFRRGTTAERNASNPILAAGEPAVVLDSGQPAELVLGDGVTAMADLRAAVWDDDARLALADTATQPGDLGTAAAADVADFATSAQGAKADTAVQPTPATIALIGTSITRQNGTVSTVPGGLGHLGYQVIDPYSSVNLLEPSGYWHWAAIMSGQRLTLVANKGIGGNTTTQMLARFDADILGLTPRPGWLLIEPGPNDAAALVTAATTIANVTEMITRARNAGMRVILATVTISASWGAVSKAERSQVDNWIKQSAPALFPGLVVVDWATPLVDETGAALPAAFVLEGDNRVHPNPYGAAIMGGVLARAINEVVPAADRLATDPADPQNLVLNPFNSGAGTVATNAALTPIGGGSITGTSSLVARTDGIPGKWQRVTLTAGDARMRVDNTDTTKWTAGTSYVYGHVEFRTDAANWTGVRGIAIGCEFIDAGGFTLSTAWGLTARSGDPDNPYNPAAGTLFLPPTLIPAGTTRLRFGVYLRMTDGGGNATLDIGRREFRVL